MEVLEGQTTIVNFALNPKPPNIKLEKRYVDSDDCVSPGDHADLVLEFFNEGGPAENVEITLNGARASYNRPDILFQDPITSQWSLSTSFIVDNIDPASHVDITMPMYIRQVIFEYVPSGSDLPNNPRFTVNSQYFEEIACPVPLCRVHFDPLSLSSQNISASLLEEDCVRHPGHVSIRRYAQFAVGNPDYDDSSMDPDDRVPALWLVNRRVSNDFIYGGLPGPLRQKDIDIVNKLTDVIGVCHNFMDLSAGLLRSLGLHTRDVWGWFYKGSKHAWNEILIDEDGNQDSWMHFDGQGIVDCKQCYANPNEQGWGSPVTVFADTVPLSNASSSIWDHRSEFSGQAACNPNRHSNYDCLHCLWFTFGSLVVAASSVDVTNEYKHTGPPTSVFTPLTATQS
ncbi:MAG: transglutaminase-like domain-containing protein, partial [Candidatus Zixiibacteriota bacterium]